MASAYKSVFYYAMKHLQKLGYKVIPLNHNYIIEPIDINAEVDKINKIHPTLCTNKDDVVRLAENNNFVAIRI